MIASVDSAIEQRLGTNLNSSCWFTFPVPAFIGPLPVVKCLEPFVDKDKTVYITDKRNKNGSDRMTRPEPDEEVMVRNGAGTYRSNPVIRRSSFRPGCDDESRPYPNRQGSAVLR